MNVSAQEHLNVNATVNKMASGADLWPPARCAGAEARAGGRRSARLQLHGSLLAGSFAGWACVLCPRFSPPCPGRCSRAGARPAPSPASLSGGSLSGRAGSRRAAAGGAVPAAARRHGDTARPMGAGYSGGVPWPRPRAAVACHVRGAIFTPWQGAAGGCRVGEGFSGHRSPGALPRDCNPVPVSLNTGFGKNRQTKLPV